MKKPQIAICSLTIAATLGCGSTPSPTNGNPQSGAEIAYNSVIVAGYLALEIVDRARSPNQKAAPPAIEGRCHIIEKAKFTGKPCTETYILFTNQKSEATTRVWVSDDGRFSLPINRGQSFKLQAFHEGETSNTVVVSQPTDIALQLETTPKQIGR